MSRDGKKQKRRKAILYSKTHASDHSQFPPPHSEVGTNTCSYIYLNVQYMLLCIWELHVSIEGAWPIIIGMYVRIIHVYDFLLYTQVTIIHLCIIHVHIATCIIQKVMNYIREWRQKGVAVIGILHWCSILFSDVDTLSDAIDSGRESYTCIRRWGVSEVNSETGGRFILNHLRRLHLWHICNGKYM